MAKKPATAANDYDGFASHYDAHNDRSPWNALYERPAALGMVGDPSGLSVLDAGCGSGAHAMEMQALGANVTGVDLSHGLLEIARTRLGRAGELVRADLSRPLPFVDGSFDLVLASLLLHYLRDWEPVLREFARVLRTSGRVVASTHHPFLDQRVSEEENYFATYRISETWNVNGHAMKMSFWHRPLRDMLAAFGSAGLRVRQIDEPLPDPSVETLHPEAFQRLMRQPRFLFFEAARE